jgi:uncharacterized protein with HEPN domain
MELPNQPQSPIIVQVICEQFLSYDAFRNDRKTQQAVIFNLLVIGEAATKNSLRNNLNSKVDAVMLRKWHLAMMRLSSVTSFCRAGWMSDSVGCL